MMDESKQIVEDGEIDDGDEIGDLEDIPDNFFDDFNNEGFMKSLQIVDSLDDCNQDDDDAPKPQEKIDQNKKNKDDTSVKKTVKKSENRKRSRSREKKHRRESPLRKRKFDDMAQRRDPAKTKRDLEKDRQNYFKKKEQKVISKIVETGLVPPGMENEVNLSTIEPDSKKDNSGKVESSKYEGVRERKSPILRERRSSISRERRRSPISRERRSPISRERRSSLLRERRRSQLSGERRSQISRERRRIRSRSRSYGRYRSRSRDRRIDVKFRSRSKGRFSRGSYSPNVNRRRRSRSISDRERWIRGRDPSPERKYQNLLKEKKIPFLEEIKMKLNGDAVAYPHPKNPVQPNFPQEMYPMTQYGQNYSQSVAPLTYNEEFFIGNQCVGQDVPQMMPMMNTVVDPSNNVFTGSKAPVSLSQNDTLEISTKVSELIARISKSTKTNLNQTDRVEKPLSLTDFLHMNQAPECSTQGEALKRKVDVLSRCQDFLKEISGDKTSTGKLKVIKTNHLKNKHENNVSPLLRQKPFKFCFNTPSSLNNYQGILNRALMKAGLITEVIDLVEDDEDNQDSAVSVTKKNVPFNRIAETFTNLSKMCQTDPTAKCEDCEKRKKIEYRSIAIQCGESERYNVGLQVVEEDLMSFKIPKNQSLAYMTPAQLLGRGDPVSSRVDNFPQRMQQDHHPYRGGGANWNRVPREHEPPGFYGISPQQRYNRY